MIVASIIGILSSIAIPKFGNMIIKAKEAAVKGHLGSMRSAMAIFYADTEGDITPSVNLIVPTYLDKIPYMTIPGPPADIYHRGLALVRIDRSCGPSIARGPWGWTSINHEKIIVSCTHTDSNGQVWSTW
jgi:general secretion pathway protein G